MCRTAENFKQLCQGGKVSQFTGNGNLPLCFAHNSFHRIITGFMAQGGDITREDGTGGDFLYYRISLISPAAAATALGSKKSAEYIWVWICQDKLAPRSNRKTTACGVVCRVAGESIYGRKFEDENFLLQHTGERKRTF